MSDRIEQLVHSGDGEWLANLMDGSLDAGATGIDIGTVAAAQVQAAPGMRIGPYKLLQQIGQGGMGVVFMAEQERPVRRRVAIKIIKPGMDSAEVIARFEAERQALALMDHPNIAHIYEAGATEAGRPYFVMELVEGLPITQFCDRRQMTPRQRLELFIPACQAIQHAHQKGIIHRDLKPSNILVMTYDGRPVPKVIDFGVAKALSQRLTEKTLFTRFGNAVGTLEYMSPEQAEMDMMGTDTRSDIYALGAILYELLTGSTPLDGKTLREAGYARMVQLIRELEPQKPSTRLSTAGKSLDSLSTLRGTEPRRLPRLLAGDLDWIVMKCLEKDRSRRYETPSALSRDIERFLAGEPVDASPPSIGYRMRRFVRKYRLGLGVAAAFVIVLVAATIISTWQAVRATRAKGVALAEKQRADEQAAVARAVNDFLRGDLLSQASPFNQLYRNFVPKRDLTVRETLDRAAQSLPQRFEKQPLVEAAIRSSLGDAYGDLGETSKAESQLLQALQTQRRFLGESEPDTLVTSQRLGELYFESSRYLEAIEILNAVLDGRLRLLGEDHRDTLRTLSYLSNAYAAYGMKHDATQILEPLHKRIAQLPASPEIATDLCQLAECYQHEGRYSEAVELLEKMRDVAIRVLGPDNKLTLQVLEGLSGAYMAEGQVSKGIKLGEDVAGRCTKTLGPNAREALLARMNLSQWYIAADRFADAVKLAEKALDSSVKVLGSDDPETIDGMMKLAHAYGWADEWDNAIRVLERRRKLLWKSDSTEDTDFIFAYSRSGRYAEAVTECERAVAATDWAKLGEFDVVYRLAAMGEAYETAGRKDELIKVLEGIARSPEDLHGSFELERVVLQRLCEAYYDLGRGNDAQKIYPRLRELQGQALSARTEWLASNATDPALHFDIGELLARMARFREAADHFAKATPLAAENHIYQQDGMNQPSESRFQRMMLLLQLGDVAEFQRQLPLELRQLGVASDWGKAYRGAVDALATPISGAELQSAAAMAEKCVHLAKGPGVAWSCQAKGIAEYRLGHYKEAIRWIEKFRDARKNARCYAEAELIIAMCRERLGEHLQACTAYEQAVHTIETRLPKAGEGDLWEFHEWILCHVLRREAEALIHPPGPATRPAAASQPVALRGARATRSFPSPRAAQDESAGFWAIVGELAPRELVSPDKHMRVCR